MWLSRDDLEFNVSRFYVSKSKTQKLTKSFFFRIHPEQGKNMNSDPSLHLQVDHLPFPTPGGLLTTVRVPAIRSEIGEEALPCLLIELSSWPPEKTSMADQHPLPKMQPTFADTENHHFPRILWFHLQLPSLIYLFILYLFYI